MLELHLLERFRLLTVQLLVQRSSIVYGLKLLLRRVKRAVLQNIDLPFVLELLIEIHHDLAKVDVLRRRVLRDEELDLHLEKELGRLLHSMVKHVVDHVATMDSVYDQTVESCALTGGQLLENQAGQLLDLLVDLVQEVL